MYSTFDEIFRNEPVLIWLKSERNHILSKSIFKRFDEQKSIFLIKLHSESFMKILCRLKIFITSTQNLYLFPNRLTLSGTKRLQN